jgi:hypothetical protein
MERFAHLALPSLGINPSLLLHESGASLQVLLNGWVLNGLEADLRVIRFQSRCELLEASTGEMHPSDQAEDVFSSHGNRTTSSAPCLGDVDLAAAGNGLEGLASSPA